VSAAAFVILVALAEPPPAVEALPLGVEEAVALALERAPELRAKRAEESAAAAERRGARAERLPQLELSAGYTRQSDIRELVTVAPDGSEMVLFPNLPNQTRSRIQLSLPLYTGGRLENLEAAAGHRERAAARDVETVAADVAFATRRAYWSLVAARESERVFREALASFEAHLEDARNRESFGLAPRNQVLAVQVERERAELRRLEAQRDAEIAGAELVLLLGLAPGRRVEPVEPLAVDPGSPPDIETLVARALARRPDRAALVARVAAAASLVGAEGAARLPTLALGAGFDYANPNLRMLPPRNQWEEGWDVGVSLRWRVFDAGRRSAASARAEARVEAAQAALEAFDRGVRLEITAASLDLGTLQASLAVAQRGLEAARENARVAGERERAGVIPSSERLDAETALLRAGLDLTRARAGLRIARARLERAAGD
jgi:outer membrane protein TolC